MVDYTFIVEDGTGLSNSNSYLTVEEADLILINPQQSIIWNELTVEDKEKYLIYYSQTVDSVERFFGSKLKTTQAMQFPRVGLPDCNDDSTIPKRLKQYIVELIFYHYSNDEQYFKVTDNAGVTMVQADSVKVQFNEYYQKDSFPEHLKYYLTGLASGYGRSEVSLG